MKDRMRRMEVGGVGFEVFFLEGVVFDWREGL